MKKLISSCTALAALAPALASPALTLNSHNASEYEILFFNFTPSHIKIDMSSCHRVDTYKKDGSREAFKYVCPNDTYAQLAKMSSINPDDLVPVSRYPQSKELLDQIPYMNAASTKDGTAVLAKSLQGPWKIQTQFLTDESNLDNKDMSKYRVYSDNLLVMKFSVNAFGRYDKARISAGDSVQVLPLYAKPSNDKDTKYANDEDYTQERMTPYDAPDAHHKVQFKIFARCDTSASSDCYQINIRWSTNKNG